MKLAVSEKSLLNACTSCSSYHSKPKTCEAMASTFQHRVWLYQLFGSRESEKREFLVSYKLSFDLHALKLFFFSGNLQIVNRSYKYIY